jgi:hypothetical protein
MVKQMWQRHMETEQPYHTNIGPKMVYYWQSWIVVSIRHSILVLA